MMPGILPRKPTEDELVAMHKLIWGEWLNEASAMYAATMQATQDNTIEAMLHHMPSAQPK